MRRPVLAALAAVLALAGGAGAYAAGLGVSSTSLRASADNNVTVPRVTTTLTATANPSAALVNQPLANTAVLSGGSTAPAVTGTITYELYGPGDATCTGTRAYSGTSAVSGNGSYTSPGYTPSTAGSYTWKVTFSGNPRNAPAPVPATCGNGGTVTVALGSPVPVLAGLRFSPVKVTASNNATGVTTTPSCGQVSTVRTCSAVLSGVSGNTKTESYTVVLVDQNDAAYAAVVPVTVTQTWADSSTGLTTSATPAVIATGSSATATQTHAFGNGGASSTITATATVNGVSYSVKVTVS